MRRTLSLVSLALLASCSQTPGPADSASEAARDATAPEAAAPDIVLPEAAATEAAPEAAVPPDASDASAPDAPLAPDVLDVVSADLDPALDASDASDVRDASAVDASDAGAPEDADAGAVDAEPIVWIPVPDAGCNARVRPVVVIPSPHVDPDGGPYAYASNPPSSGPHYSLWAHWGTWPVLARGNWVHNLEHGGVVLLNRCVTGMDCAPGLAALSAVVPSFSTDPVCVPPPPPDAEPVDAGPPAVRVRVVVTNDDNLDAPVYAVSWGWLYAADCLDAPSLRRFYEAHRGMGTEDFCDDGYVP